jgi:hypothetical protein
MQNRRTFIGSAAAVGLGTAVGGAFFPTFSTHAQGQNVADPVFAELRRQLHETVIAVRKGRGRAGEHARRIAANIRLLNAHGAVAAADAQIQRLLKREGRELLLTRDMDLNLLGREMQAFGVNRLPTLSATYTDRARMLDATAGNGVAATLSALGTAFEQIAPALDRAATRTVARQDDETCWQWLLVLTGLESMMWEWFALGLTMGYLILTFFLAWASFMCSLGCACII